MGDTEGRIVLVNRQIESIFGYPREEILNKPIEMLLPHRFRSTYSGERASFRSDPRVRAVGMGHALHGLRKNGEEFPIEIGLTPVETSAGMFALATIADMTERKRAEQDRRRLEDDLRQAQKMEVIGRLTSGIAHEFNNLLMGINGCGELAKRTLPAGHAAFQVVHDICDASRRGALLTRDLLDFSRRTSVGSVVSDLNAVVRVAERMLRRMIPEDVVLAVELPASIGLILANPTHLEHILLNLAVNARDAMPHGGRLRIATRELKLEDKRATRVRTLPAGDYVVLEIEDSGVGMDEVTQASLFEAYFTTKSTADGTGFGLFTVYSMVEQMGGGIELDSEVGRGTKFRIYVPRYHGNLAAFATRPGEADLVRPPAQTPIRILVVEDERLIRVSLGKLLAGLGHDVLLAENGQRAVEVARTCEGSIDLVLSDIVLPDAGGTEIATLLTRARPAIRVLFMSAYPNDLLVQQGRILPGTRTLEKPFDEAALVDAIRHALTRAPQPTAGMGIH